MYQAINADGFINNYMDAFANAYFPNESNAPRFTGISIKNEVSRKFEDEKIVNYYLKEGKIDKNVVAWKAGRLLLESGKYVPQMNKKGDCLNGYGIPIKEDKLNDYLVFVSEKYKRITDKSNFMYVYQSLISQKNVPRNFGSIYIINLIYFLSKGRYPIYDKFAHKALKALYMGKNPCEIFVGDAPGKYEANKVVNMYQEYLWFLDKVFPGEKRTIGLTENESKESFLSRKIDRALWVYGHATKKIPEEELKEYSRR